MLRCVVGWSLTLAGIAAAGCQSHNSGPARLGLTGAVSFQGQKLPEGDIVFMPDKGHQGPTSGGKIVNGKYGIKDNQGVVPGPHRVEITSWQKTGQQIPAGSPFPPGTMVDEIAQVIPARYNADSELTVDPQPGKASFDFDLQGPAENSK